jgi:hypothetical protein
LLNPRLQGWQIIFDHRPDDLQFNGEAMMYEDMSQTDNFAATESQDEPNVSARTKTMMLHRSSAFSAVVSAVFSLLPSTLQSSNFAIDPTHKLDNVDTTYRRSHVHLV